MPKMVHSVVRGYRAIASREIRAVVVHELQRLRADQPELRWEVLDEIDDKIMAAPACDPSTYPTGYRQLTQDRDSSAFTQYETVNDTVTDTVADTVSAHTYTPTPLHTNTPHPRTHARAGASVATLGDQHAAQRPGGRASAADIVKAWKRASGVPITDSTATGMRLAVSQAMRAGHDEQTIAAGLGAWAQSNI